MKLIPAILLLTVLAGCRSVEHYADDPFGNFDALWNILDSRYCYFESKQIDWEATGREYRQRLRPEMTDEELFGVMAAMLDELRDGHTNLSSPFNTSYYRRWWSDYPQDFDQRLVDRYYLNFDWRQAAGLSYGLLPGNVGYIRYASFSSPIGDGNIDYVLHYLRSADALIIDIRNNGGGDLTNATRLASHFIEQPTTAGYVIHKTGPRHGDFSEPYPIEITPAKGVRWGKPTAVLTNRSTFSAANNLTQIMKDLPQVKIVGAQTGGGGAMPFNATLPNGWTVRFSTSPTLDSSLRDSENGIPPSEGCAVGLDIADALAGTDTMIERAIEILTR